MSKTNSIFSTGTDAPGVHRRMSLAQYSSCSEQARPGPGVSPSVHRSPASWSSVKRHHHGTRGAL